MRKPAVLLLEDGTLFNGFSFGYDGEALGECCFNTAMIGYQEVITDPAYAGQIVALTYPVIGNYGTNAADMESAAPKTRGLIVREYSRHFENWRAEISLDKFLLKYKISGIEGIDTRKLTRHLRDKGAMRCIISSVDADKKSLLAKAQAAPQMTGLDLVGKVTTKKPYAFSEKGKYKITVYDLGCAQSILTGMAKVGAAITVVPATTPAAEILAQKPDGVFLSNGPGDPAAVKSVIENVRRLIDSDMFVCGIGLGFQIIGLALGAKTFKLKYGHHGSAPIKDLTTGQVEVVAQDHNFALDENSLENLPIDITHINLNDKTVAGFAHKTRPVAAYSSSQLQFCLSGLRKELEK